MNMQISLWLKHDKFKSNHFMYYVRTKLYFDNISYFFQVKNE